MKLSVHDDAAGDWKDVISNSCLDFPRNRQLCTGKSIVSGWVLADGATNRASLVVRSGENQVTQELSVERGDVLTNILGVSDNLLAGHPQLKCGFSFELDFQFGQRTVISLELDGFEYPWKIIDFEPSDVSVSGVALERMWSEYCHGEEPEIRAWSEQLHLVEDSVLQEFLFENTHKYLTADVLNGKEIPWLERCLGFLQYVNREAFCIDAVQSATTEGLVIVPDPLGYGMAFSNESYLFSSQINVLRFLSSTGEVFFIFQHFGSADAIYFPTRGAMVAVHHFDTATVKSFICRFVRNFSRISEYCDRDRRFLGIIASHGRPYHFYYDVAPAVSDLNQSGVLGGVEQIVYYSGGDFCSFKNLYELDVIERRLTPDELWLNCIVERGFYFHVGAVFGQARLNSTARFDDEFNTYSRKQFIQQQASAPAELLACYPLVWFGVTVDKRSWIEQVEGAVGLLTELKKSYPNIGVVFDGWTAPLHPTARDLEETKKDSGVVEQIVAQLAPGIRVFSVVGADSVRKLFYGRCADVYVGNSATGGLHVARFSGCPGVGHLNTQMIDVDYHIRKRTRLVDKSLIIDQSDSVRRGMDFISYSLDWRVVYKEVRDILLGVSV
jgi:hypothetical protein